MRRLVLLNFREEHETQVSARNCSAHDLLDVALQLNAIELILKTENDPGYGDGYRFSIAPVPSCSSGSRRLFRSNPIVEYQKQIIANMNLSAVNNDLRLHICIYATRVGFPGSSLLLTFMLRICVGMLKIRRRREITSKFFRCYLLHYNNINHFGQFIVAIVGKVLRLSNCTLQFA